MPPYFLNKPPRKSKGLQTFLKNNMKGREKKRACKTLHVILNSYYVAEVSLRHLVGVPE